MVSSHLRLFTSVNILLLGVFMNAFAQSFWLTTHEFPGGAKTGIAAVSGCLFVSTGSGIWRSCNEGIQFDRVLTSEAVFTLYGAASGTVYAGGRGKVYLSHNNGESWDSTTISDYPIVQYIENSSGTLFAITGELTVEDGFVGDGVFSSGDQGMTWQQRNIGLGIFTSCERIAIDRYDRLYLAVADEFVSGNAGLFISDDHGLSWEHINLLIDGQGVFDDAIKVGNTRGLTISPGDSINMSFTGTAVNVGVQLNVRKSIHDIYENTYWRVFSVFNSVSWWLDRPLQQIHYAQNGDWYSSTAGTLLSGATYFSQDQGQTWTHIDYGLGLNIFGGRSAQTFAEMPSGRIFMTQFLDERVYTTDTSITSGILFPTIPTLSLTLYPNPVSCGVSIYLDLPDIHALNGELRILDLYGRLIHMQYISTGNAGIQTPFVPGMYLLQYFDGTVIRCSFFSVH